MAADVEAAQRPVNGCVAHVLQAGAAQARTTS